MSVVARRSGLLVLAAALLSSCSHATAPAPQPDLTSPGTVAPAPAPVVRPGVHLTSIKISSIGVNSHDFMEIGLNPDKTMEEPPLSFPKLIAWYRLSPVPGDPGASVVVSHRNGNGIQGGFAKLDSVKVGDTVEISRSDGQTAVFKVNATNLYPKAAYPTWAAKVFGTTPTPTLRLITCSGDLGPGPVFYQDNRVVSADLVSLKPTGP